ncbi:MAG TPA: hypothetical protein VFY18_02410 [Candidatus Limnocylindrales bacterium]|nr:hypothetical protein [Candidatus Limnocylindrales bacterium]
MAARRIRAGLIVLAMLIGSCASQPSPEPTPPTAIAQGQGFVLAMAFPADHFAPGDAIDVKTTLAWIGPAPNVTVWGSGMGPIGFMFEELTGRHRMMGGAMTADCVRHPFPQGVTAIPLTKSGGWTGDDPDAVFYSSFYADPQLHLPAGRWRITAELDGTLAECAMDAPGVSLKAVLEIGVG